MVDVNLSRATNAYQQQLKLMEGMAAPVEEAKGPSFGEMLGSALHSAVETGHKAERAQIGALTGEVDLSDLVTAVSEAELTLSTVIAVRDRVISAYQEIIRMPI